MLATQLTNPTPYVHEQWSAGSGRLGEGFVI